MSRVICCFGDPSRKYFRHELFTTYKSKRSPEPESLWPAINAIKDEFPSRLLSGLEGDDVMGILATYPGLTGKKIVVSDDKDMRTIPCTLYPGRKSGKRFPTMTPTVAICTRLSLATAETAIRGVRGLEMSRRQAFWIGRIRPRIDGRLLLWLSKQREGTDLLGSPRINLRWPRFLFILVSSVSAWVASMPPAALSPACA